MTKKADIGSKRLISLDLQAWVEWIMQNSQMQALEILSAEFQWVSREGDVLIRAQDPAGEEFLIANEIQLRYSPKMPRRMRAYAALAEEKFQMPVYPVLVIILPASDTEIVKSYESEVQGKQEGIRIGEQVAQNLLATGMEPSQVAMVTGLSLD